MTQTIAPRFYTMSIKHLASRSEHPEVQRSALEIEIGRIRRGAYNLALTHEGEVLGFWLAALPETVPVESETTAAMNRSNMRLDVIRKWQQYDCVRLTRRSRECGVFVPVKHQNWLPLPIINQQEQQ